MIQQSIQHPIQQPFYDRASQCSGSGVERSWLGHGVAVSKALVESLIPMEDPCFSINPYKTLQDIGRLAATTILPWSTIVFMVKDITDACSASGLPGPDVKPESPQESNTIGEAQEKRPDSKDVPLQQPSTACYQVIQGAKGLLALGTLASAFQYANSESIADGSKPIKINDAETLGKIGRHPDFPRDGTYQQTADIDLSQHHHQSIVSFTGKYDGQCRTIKGLSECFVDTLEQGSISHLGFTDAAIVSWNKPAGLAACTVNGTVSDIWAENVRIVTTGWFSFAGIGGGRVEAGGMVANTTALNSRVETSGPGAYAGIGGGRVTGTAANITAVNIRVETSGFRAYTGIGGGRVIGTVANTTVVNSCVKTSGSIADAGIGGGRVEAGGTVANTTAVNSRVTTSGNYTDTGIGGGRVKAGGTVVNTTALNSWVITSGNHTDTGIGVGRVKVGGTVVNTTAVNSWVKTSGYLAFAGIGGGVVEAGGTVANTTAVNCNVTTSGFSADAGIGGGLLLAGGTVVNTTAVNSRVKTSGELAFAGIGVGWADRAGMVDNPTAVNCAVNGQIKKHGNVSVHQLSTLCQKADPRVLTANCSSRTDFLNVLDFSYSDVCPVNAASLSTAASVSTAAAVGITLGSLVAVGGLGIVGYTSYKWITGYQEGLRGQELIMNPLARGRELASAAVNWVSQGLREPENE